MLIKGACHCRNLSFTLTCPSNIETLPARACTCSFCRKHAAIWTTLPAASLRVVVKDPALISRYAFDTGTAEFHVCARCGVVPVVTSRIEGRLYAVVNTWTFEDFDPSSLQHAATNFDGESEEERLSRRKRHWIANVEFSEGDM